MGNLEGKIRGLKRKEKKKKRDAKDKGKGRII